MKGSKPKKMPAMKVKSMPWEKSPMDKKADAKGMMKAPKRKKK